MNKTVWFDGREIEAASNLWPLLFSQRFEYAIVQRSALGILKAPSKLKFIVECRNEEDCEDLSMEVIIMSRNRVLLESKKAEGYVTAFIQQIGNQEEMDSAWQAGMKHDFLIAEFKDVTNIPLELLIARLQQTDTKILKAVDSAQDAEIAFGVMEVGCHGVVLETKEAAELVKMNELLGKQEQGKLNLVKGVVRSIEHIGMGYRACVDTTSLMTQIEGMIIGSTSRGGLLVSSETHYLPYMELRPFRVNAGAIHSYIWTPQGMTEYLANLKAGSRVLCVDVEGNTREVSVGRVKTEMRPLIKIEVDAGNEVINTIVQDDWHIRILGFNGEPYNASTLKPGDELAAYICSGGRHVGIKIDEHFEEK
ncbi:3-dehydroquinate synthase [Paenibacillus sp. FSL R7-277]|uniref:3-dehydroquinate synthase II n=1 Tax=unclassified Paenibacillus TaxID=185978 RepID=UPI0003E1C7D2|nr:3-dehydroquinate synthase II [Paenibacillus sp. FSL R7-277]ETT65441.1 3-dehydroquinate synthase [Paenibacillus sp. FSL R7-277]